MSTPLPFSEEHRDCLQEVCNIAMGAAGESLANFTQLFVNLSIPKIRYLKPREITEALSSLRGANQVSSAAQLFTMDEHRGYAVVVITEPSFKDLAAATGRRLHSDADAAALLTELTRTINQTCLPRLAELIQSRLDLDEAELLSLHVPFEQFCLSDVAGWDQLVSVEINYHLEDHPFNCDLLLLLPEPVVDQFTAALETLLND